MNNCNTYQERISAFIDGLLTESERLELMEHMASCPDCQAFFDDQIAIHDALTELDAEVPAGFADQVMARVRETAQDKPEKKVISFPVWRRWAATAACCAIAMLGVWTMGGDSTELAPSLARNDAGYSVAQSSSATAAADTVETETTAEQDAVANDVITYAAESYSMNTSSGLQTAASPPVAESKLAEKASDDTAAETTRVDADGCTLPGATEINPSVMVNGQIYSWAGMAIGGAPEGFTLVSELRHIEGDTLTGDGQFIATFEAEGQIYANPGHPDTVYVQITTDWLDKEYVKFTLAE